MSHITRKSKHKNGKPKSAASASSTSSSQSMTSASGIDSNSHHKVKFPSSQEVFHRLRTDSAHFHDHLCILGYNDNRRGVLEMPLDQFIPISEGGDIPWHRVACFKYRKEIIWERATKICKLDEVAALANDSDMVPLPLRFSVLTFNIMDDHNRVRLAHSARHEVAEAHRITNLSRAVNPVDELPAETSSGEPSTSPSAGTALPIQDLIQSANLKRFSGILMFLLAIDADIVCLQEVSPEFVTFLDADPILSIRWPYRAITSLEYQNIMFLSKATIHSSHIITIDLAKQFLAIEVKDPIAHVNICFIGVHLTSSRATRATSKRATQLSILAQHLTGALCAFGTTPAIVLGDFNTHEVSLQGMEDAVCDEYFSFDPRSNELAQNTTISGIPQALDKVLVRTVTSAVRSGPVSVQTTGEWKLHTHWRTSENESNILTNQEEKSDLSNAHRLSALSDHFPLQVEFEIIQPDSTSASLTSISSRGLDVNFALVILPDPSQFARIDSVRSALGDKRLLSWMPHITLAHPFLSEEDLQNFLDDTLRSPLCEVLHQSTLEIVFDHAEYFQHAVKQTHFLAPQSLVSPPPVPDDSPSASSAVSDSSTRASCSLTNLRRLYAILRSRYPTVFGCEAHDFQPHLTLGPDAPSEEQLNSLLTDGNGERSGLRFHVDALYVVRKNGTKNNARYVVTHRLPLIGAVTLKNQSNSESPGNLLATQAPKLIDLEAQVIQILSLQTAVVGVKWMVGGSRAFNYLTKRSGGDLSSTTKLVTETDQFLWSQSSSSTVLNKLTPSCSSDVDVVAILPPTCLLSAGEFLVLLSRHISSIGLMQFPQVITGRHEIYLKVLWKLSVGVDIHVSTANELESSTVSESVTVASDSSLQAEMTSVLSISSNAPPSMSPVREPWMIWNLLNSTRRRKLFLHTRNVIVSSAKQVGIYGASAGYLPGISWSILAAALAMRWPEDQIPQTEESDSARLEEIKGEILKRFADAYGSEAAFELPITVQITKSDRSGSNNSSSSSSSSNGSSSSIGDTSASQISPSSGVLTRTADAQLLVRGCGPGAKLMQILTCSDLVPRNSVRTVTKETMRVLLTEFSSCFKGDTLRQRFVWTLEVSADLAHYTQLYECYGWMQEKLPSLIVQLSRQVGDLRPFPITSPAPIEFGVTESESAPLQLGFTWSVGHGTNTSMVDLLCGRMIQQLRPLYTHVTLHTSTKSQEGDGTLV